MKKLSAFLVFVGAVFLGAFGGCMVGAETGGSAWMTIGIIAGLLGGDTFRIA